MLALSLTMFMLWIFFAKKLLSFSCSNNLPGAYVLITNLCNCLKTENLKYVVIAMESTSPFQGSCFVALQRLTRQRLHIVENLNREKSFALSNIFLKFSELAVLDKNEQPFSDKFGATASSIITEFLTPDEIASLPLEDLINFICEKGKNRFSNPKDNAKLLQKACRDSYRLDKSLYDTLNTAIGASFNCISSLEKQIKELDKAILKAVKGLSSNEYQCLLSIKGIGPVFAAGIIAEIGFISRFPKEKKLAKFAGLCWRKRQSGNFTASNTFITKAGNKYLRYYLLEATGSVIRSNDDYKAFYQKKFNEVSRFQHKRALALTTRKFVRLVFSMLQKNQLYIDTQKEMVKLT